MSIVGGPHLVSGARHRSRGVTIERCVRLLVLVGVVATVAVASVAFLNIVRNRELTREAAEASAADRYFLANDQVRDLIVARVLESLYRPPTVRQRIRSPAETSSRGSSAGLATTRRRSPRSG